MIAKVGNHFKVTIVPNIVNIDIFGRERKFNQFICDSAADCIAIQVNDFA